MVLARKWMIAAVLAPMAAVGLLGCQARQMVDQYLSFDAIITDLYDKHVLYNLARRDTGRTMVQMSYRGFSANLNFNTSMSGKIQFFTNPQDKDGNLSVSLYNFRQAFEPNVSNSRSSGLGISSGPADHQTAIRALYDQQVERPYEDRIFCRTTSVVVAMRSYCWIRSPEGGDLYYVPQDKRREFSDFVERVCFYEPSKQEDRSARPAPLPPVQPAPPPPAEPEAGEPGPEASQMQPAPSSRPAGVPLGMPGPWDE